VAEGAEMVHMEGIVGAFLAGIAVRRATGHAHLHEGMEVTARYTFIPSFFMATGMLIEPGSVLRTLLHSPWLTAAIVGSLLLGKYVAAWLSAKALRYPAAQVPGMWALTTPQVAATLAAAVVASQTLNAQGAPLIDANLLNVVLVLVMVTAIGGPIITQRLLRAG
jgi:Kef-type K+ transport system membrane component KefB